MQQNRPRAAHKATLTLPFAQPPADATSLTPGCHPQDTHQLHVCVSWSIALRAVGVELQYLDQRKEKGSRGASASPTYQSHLDTATIRLQNHAPRSSDPLQNQLASHPTPLPATGEDRNSINCCLLFNLRSHRQRGTDQSGVRAQATWHTQKAATTPPAMGKAPLGRKGAQRLHVTSIPSMAACWGVLL